MGELLTRWTIRIALLLCAGSIAAGFWSRQPGQEETRQVRLFLLARWLWTLAFTCYLLHLSAAFQFYHAWSHEKAWDHTAERTNEVLGVNWGGGVWFNYLFTVAWGVDVAWSWLKPIACGNIPRGLRWAWGVWFAMIVFFATVVFEDGWTRWISVATLVLLALWAVWIANSNATSSGQEERG